MAFIAAKLNLSPFSDALLKKCSQALRDNFTAKYGCAANVYRSEFDAVSARITKAASRPQE